MAGGEGGLCFLIHVDPLGPHSNVMDVRESAFDQGPVAQNLLNLGLFHTEGLAIVSYNDVENLRVSTHRDDRYHPPNVDVAQVLVRDVRPKDLGPQRHFDLDLASLLADGEGHDLVLSGAKLKPSRVVHVKREAIKALIGVLLPMNRRGFIGGLSGFFGTLLVGKKAVALSALEVEVEVASENEPQETERRLTDLKTMFAEISAHTISTGDVIVSADLPKSLLYGFKSVSKTHGQTYHWLITIPNMQRSMQSWFQEPGWEGQKARIYAEYLKTAKMREVLCLCFPGQNSTPAQRRSWLPPTLV